MINNPTPGRCVVCGDEMPPQMYRGMERLYCRPSCKGRAQGVRKIDPDAYRRLRELFNLPTT